MTPRIPISDPTPAPHGLAVALLLIVFAGAGLVAMFSGVVP